MQTKIFFTLILLAWSTGLFAQQPETKPIRIVDTLTASEKINRNPVILKSELDSLILLYNASQVPTEVKNPQKETVLTNTSSYILAGLVTVIFLLGFLIYMFYRHQHKINRTIAGLNEIAKHPESRYGNNGHTVTKEKKGKAIPASAESKMEDLNAELHKLSKENEGLNRVIKEYNGIQHDYDSLKQGILKSYKVKNYPGYDKTKDDTNALCGVLDTENAVAKYAYEKFLKPILAITDANKNTPAKLSETDQAKLLDLLVSLSLLYIEYLYLRVNELSVGGTIVERIKGFGKGNGLDISLLRKLNTESGSRALVLKMALRTARLQQLSYPVFDETNLNNS